MFNDKLNSVLGSVKARKNLALVKASYAKTCRKRLSRQQEEYMAEALAAHTVDEVLLMLFISELRQEECIVEMQRRRFFPSFARMKVKNILQQCSRLASTKNGMAHFVLEDFEELKRSLSAPSIAKDIWRCL